jgi:sodium/potassium-transporting ATPase subunit alpha
MIRKYLRVTKMMIPANVLSLLTIKGAPDILINRCYKYTSIDGETKVLDATTRATIEEIKNTWSSEGKRVILLARKIVPKENIVVDPSSSRFEDEVMRLARTDLTLVGIVGIVDPPRDEIPYVVSTLRGAGIRIFMVSLVEFYLRYVLR